MRGRIIFIYAVLLVVLAASAAAIITVNPDPEDMTETVVLDSMADETQALFLFTKTANLGVYEAEVFTKNATSSPELTITAVDLPEGTPAATAESEIVFAYLQIDSSIENANIDASMLRFQLPVGWVSDNNIPLNKIFLKKYENSAWTKFKPMVIDQNDEFYYFETETNGFSLFAITGEAQKKAEPAAVTTSAVAKLVDLTGIGVTLAVVIIGLAGYFVYRRFSN